MYVRSEKELPLLTNDIYPKETVTESIKSMSKLLIKAGRIDSYSHQTAFYDDTKGKAVKFTFFQFIETFDRDKR